MSQHTVSRALTFPGDIDLAWEIVSDFGGWWRFMMPGMDDSGYVAPAEPVTERGGEVAPGQFVKEELRDVDHATRSISYSLTVSPFPVSDHLATFSLAEEANGAITATWSATFTADEAMAAQMDHIMGESAFAPGLAGLAAKLAQ